jgi:hypothetical protein
MRRRIATLTRMLLVGFVTLLVAGCTITTLQWQDFLTSTGVRVVAQVITSFVEAWGLNRWGTTQ